MNLAILRHITIVSTLGAMISLALQSEGHAQVKPSVTNQNVAKPSSILWVGNSYFYYNNSMHGHVRAMVAAAGSNTPLRQTSVTISGSGFGWHDVDGMFRPNAIGSYSFVGDNEIRFNRIEKLFDIALMMDCSQCPVHPELSKIFTEYAKRYSDDVRKHGAQPVFFMSWAYSDKPEMTQQLSDAYVKAGNDNNALVVPAGLAFARSIARRPDINLYEADKRHPSLAGTYLGAATVYAALFRASPVGLRYAAGLPADVATHLQQIAHETVTEFYRQ